MAFPKPLKAQAWILFNKLAPLAFRKVTIKAELPQLAGQKPGDSFKLTFTGTAVGIMVIAGPAAGITEHSVDGSAWVKKDLFTRRSDTLAFRLRQTGAMWQKTVYYSIAANIRGFPNTRELILTPKSSRLY